MQGVIRKNGKRILPALAVWIGLGLIAVLPVWADPCSGCTAPSVSEISAGSSLSLDTRSHWFWGTNTDYVLVDAGTCMTSVSSVSVVNTSWHLVELAKGSVQKCPSLTNTGTVRVTVSESESTGWSLTASASASATLLGTGVTAAIAGTLDKETGLTRVTEVSYNLQAGYCRKVYWTVFLEKAEPVATVTVDISQEWAWWTKNASTGSTVHQMGMCTKGCGSVDLEYTCQFPVSFYLHTAQAGCSDPECALVPSGEIGFSPPLPNGLEPPDGWESPIPGPIVWPDGSCDNDNDTDEPAPTVDD